MTLQRAYEWPRRHPLVVDTAVAVLLFLLFGLVGVLGIDRGDISTGPVEAVVSVTMTLALALRRVRPVLAFTVVCVSCLVQVLVWPDALPADIVFPFAVYSVAAWATDRRVRAAALGVAGVAGFVAALRWNATVGVHSIVSVGLLVGISVVAWVAGDLVRSRRAVQARLAEQHDALLRDREQREQLAAQRERSRIARDMHDVVAHGLSVIVVQADGAAFAARHAPRWDREAAAETLETLAATAREALAETRHLVGMLRRDDGGADPDDFAPTAGLTDLPALVERLRDAGLVVDLATEDAAARDVPTDTSLAAYRIAQESLTNVLRHGGPSARALVRVARDGEGLVLDVVDDGRGAAAEDARGGGSGIIGMRERAAAVGGTVDVGPRPEGGYRVRATLPVPAVVS